MSGEVKVMKNMAEFNKVLADAGALAVCVDFTASWCGPCKIIGPKFVDMAKEFAGKIVCIKVDVDECEDVAAEHKISAMPTFIVFKDSKKVDELVGASEAKLKELVMKYCAFH